MATEREKVHVFVTKHALARGILEMDLERSSAGNDILYAGHCKYYHRPDWWPDLTSAKARVRIMLDRKKAAINKQLKEFKELEERAMKVSKGE
jgi:hypothetical protein